MERRVSWSVALAVTVGLLLDIACDIKESREGAGTALDFSIELVGGSPMNATEFFGSVVLINFWDTRCGRCLAEQDELNRLHDDFQDAGLVIIGISLARNGIAEVENYLSANHVLYISGIVGESVEAMFGVPATLPHTFIINRAGEIAHDISGGRNYDEFLRLVLPLLAE